MLLMKGNDLLLRLQANGKQLQSGVEATFLLFQDLEASNKENEVEIRELVTALLRMEITCILFSKV